MRNLPQRQNYLGGFVPPCKFKDGDIIADEHGNIAIYKGTMWYNKKLAEYYCGYRKSDNHFLPEPKRDGHFGVIEELHHATEEEKEKLFQAIKNNGYKWNDETKTLDKLIEPKFKVGNRIKQIGSPTYYIIKNIEFDRYILHNNQFIKFGDEHIYELVPNKFDISTLTPFESKVLVRHNKDNKWTGSFFSFIDRDLHSHCYKFVTTADKSYPMMIPYKGNEYLLGKTDDCQDFYKTWES
jgi:hypothetical protein